MWNPLRYLRRTPEPPSSEVQPHQAHADYWGCAGHEVRKKDASVSGGLFAVWHFPPTRQRRVGVYITCGVAASRKVEFLCLTATPSPDPWDDPFARFLMEAALFKSQHRPILGTFDVIPLAEGALPDPTLTHALYAPPGLFFNVEELEATLQHPLVLAVPIDRDELKLLSTGSAEAFLKTLASRGVEPRADRAERLAQLAS
jgi:hypothetical protein